MLQLTHTLLEFATKAKDIVMNYANYESSIVERYKVKLVGWTYPQLVSPSEIGAMGDIRKLRDALKSGSCKWVRLSKPQMKQHMADVESRRSQGEVIGKKRKERSDKGKKHLRKTTNAPDGKSPASDGDGDGDGDGDAEEHDKHPRKKKKVPVSTRSHANRSDDSDEETDKRPQKKQKKVAMRTKSRTNGKKTAIAARSRKAKEAPVRSKSIISDTDESWEESADDE